LPDSVDWQEYLVAARRKIEIADYHLQFLRNETKKGFAYPPTIPVQAHFEGILYSFVATIDQIAEAINQAMGFNERPPGLMRKILNHSNCPVKVSLNTWFNAPIAVDVRDVRVRATHHHYAKVPNGSALEVQKPFRRGREPYGGSRELVAYGTAASNHLHGLLPVVDSLERELECGIASARAGDRAKLPGQPTVRRT
jgi:hypothetical protein